MSKKKEIKIQPIKEDRSSFNCPDCKGDGLDKRSNLCPTCGGTGKI